MVTNRDPEKTRQALLEAAFDEIHSVGFRSASVDRILATTGVTKGALYHHFKNKNELGYAVVDELIDGYIQEVWIEPLAAEGDAIEVILSTVNGAIAWVAEHCMMEKGCPLNNLAQEMSNIDEGFRQRIEARFESWRRGFADALRRGQANGSVRTDIDADDMGLYILATLEGMQSIVKNKPDMEMIQRQFALFETFLRSLAPQEMAA